MMVIGSDRQIVFYYDSDDDSVLVLVFRGGTPFYLGHSPGPAFSGRSMSQLPTNEPFPAPTDFGADPRPISGAYNLTTTNVAVG
jgi:hypothetical protein